MNSTMMILNEDVIREIVMRLPLKCTIRCMVLNKSLFRLISQWKKTLASSAYPDIEGSIFCRYIDTFKRNTPGSCEILSITTPPENPSVILDSCNGVLLLYFVKQALGCVFNPITSEIVPVSPLVSFVFRYDVTHALAVDLDAPTIFQFKLVVAETLFTSEKEETLWRFTVHDPSGGTPWWIKSPVELVYKGNRCLCKQFVYVHGCVYYVDDVNDRMVVFDVENEEARSIDWPQGADALLYRSLDGSLQRISTLKDEFEIYSYDQVKHVWQLKHKITNIASDRHVAFCNGQRLLISNDYRGREHGKVLHIYDISSKKWEKVPKDFIFYCRHSHFSFVSFVPTLAKVSDKYLHDPDFEFAKVYLRVIQRLVMQETIDPELI